MKRRPRIIVLAHSQEYKEALRIIISLDTMFPGIEELKIQHRVLKFHLEGILAVETSEHDSLPVRIATSSLLANKDINMALDYLLANPKSEDLVAIFNHAGMLLKYSGSFSKAARCFRQALLIDDNPRIRNNLAHALVGDEKYQEALAAFAKAAESKDELWEYFLLKKCLLHFFLCEFEAAIQGFEILIAQNPKAHTAKIRLAYLLKDLDQNNRAIELFHQLLYDRILESHV